MPNAQSENPGAASILQRGDESNHLANGLGSDGSEPCSTLHDCAIFCTCGSVKSVSNWVRASFFATAFSSKINLHNKCLQESFSSMCARFPSKIFRSCYLAWDQSTTRAYKRHSHPFVLATLSGVLLFLRQSLCNTLLRQHSPMSGRKALIKLVDWRVYLPLDPLRFASKLLCNCYLKWDQSTVQNKCVQASFSSMRAPYFVGSLFFETTRAGSTCPSQNVHRHVIALQRPAT